LRKKSTHFLNLTFFESGIGSINWHILPETNEVIWFSQRDNWGHLYLYNMETGELKNQITNGNWNVLQLLRMDTDNRVFYFTGAGRETGDPYFQYFYRINMDGTGLKLLTPNKANHSVTLSPSGQRFIDSYSTPVDPPIAEVRTVEGNTLLMVEKADISQLIKSGWVPPVPFSVKARDGKTDIYGLLFKPTNLDPKKKYPIVNYIYCDIFRCNGDANAVKIVSRRVLRQYGRQRASRPDNRYEAAC